FVSLPRRQNAAGAACAAGHGCDDPIADELSAELFLGHGSGDAVGTKVANDAVIGLCRTGRDEGEEECAGEQQDPRSLHVRHLLGMGASPWGSYSRCAANAVRRDRSVTTGLS